ncbi:MAG: hypothetical protein U0271_13320 [Polyangiaceae bacterium]
MRHIALFMGLLAATACGSSQETAARPIGTGPSASASAAAAPPPTPDAPARVQFVPERPAIATTDRWEIYRGVVLPDVDTFRLGFYDRATSDFAYIAEGSEVAVAKNGNVLTFGGPSFLVPPTGEPISIKTTLDAGAPTPDGSEFIAQSEQTLYAIDASTGKIRAHHMRVGDADLAVQAATAEVIVLGRDPYYDIVMRSTLESVVTGITGPIGSAGRYAVNLPPTPDDPAPLEVYDLATGKLLLQKSIVSPSYSRAGYRQIKLTPDDAHLTWMSDSYHVLDLDTQRERTVDWASPTGAREGDADTSYGYIPSADGSRVCFTEDQYSVLVEVATKRRVTSTRGPVFCRAADGFAQSFVAPVTAKEETLEFLSADTGRTETLIQSPDGRVGMFLISKRVKPGESVRSYSLVLVRGDSEDTLARLDLGVAAVEQPTLQRSIDEASANEFPIIEFVAAGRSFRIDWNAPTIKEEPRSPN